MGRISCSWWTFHMATTASDRLLAAFRSRLMAPSPTAISRSVFRHSFPTAGLGLLVLANAMDNSTWRAGIAALWNASVDDTASTYFLATHGKTSLCKFNPNIEYLLIFMKKLSFVCILDYVTFLAH
jgi:hypothetical protein